MNKRIRLVNEFLYFSAINFPEKTALITDTGRYSYHFLNKKADILCQLLIKNGVTRHDRIILFLDNTVELVISIFAVLKAGCCFVIMNPTTKSPKLNFIMKDCTPSALITHTSKMSIVNPVLNNAKHFLRTIVIAEREDPKKKFYTPDKILLEYFDINASRLLHSDQNTLYPIIDVDLAAIVYTSGSTGEPKGVMLTHRNIVNTATAIAEYLENNKDDIIIDVLPLSFDYGLYQIFTAFLVGATVILERSFTYIYKIVDTILREHITGFPGVPTVFGMLFKLKDADKYTFKNVKYVTNTAAALPPKYIDNLRKMFPNARIYSMYGLTECTRTLYMPPEELFKKPTSVGKAIPNEEVFIIKENGELAEPEEIGELVVRGTNIMAGYWNKPEETNAIIKEGIHPDDKLLYTGDLFKKDNDGFFYFIARKDDIIKTRGEKVSPKEVEDIIYNINDVLEVVVDGVPDELLGEAIRARIVKAHNSILSEKDVLHYCASQLENFMVPKYIEFCSSLPKTSSGKIKRK